MFDAREQFEYHSEAATTDGTEKNSDSRTRYRGTVIATFSPSPLGRLPRRSSFFHPYTFIGCWKNLMMFSTSDSLKEIVRALFHLWTDSTHLRSGKKPSAHARLDASSSPSRSDCLPIVLIPIYELSGTQPRRPASTGKFFFARLPYQPCKLKQNFRLVTARIILIISDWQAEHSGR